MSSNGQKTDKIAAAARRLGYEVNTSYAGTGTRYVICRIESNDDCAVLRIRVADHMEAHAPPRGVRQLSVAPGEATVSDAIAALREGPASVPRSEGPRPLDHLQKQVARQQNQRKRRFKVNWVALRNKLTEQDHAEFQRLGGNRPAARAVARSRGWSVAAAYTALTDGKKWNRSHR